jgi:hypothetical protein
LDIPSEKSSEEYINAGERVGSYTDEYNNAYSTIVEKYRSNSSEEYEAFAEGETLATARASD